jgi:hypothetical protein
MPDDSDEGEGLSKSATIDKIIEIAFDSMTDRLLASLQADYDFERLETKQGTAISFTIRAHGGSLHCLYFLRPAVEALLEKYSTEGESAIVAPLFLRLLHDLPLATEIGMMNAHDSASLAALEGLEARLSVMEQSKVNDSRKRRSITLKNMNARNAALVESPKTGPQADVTLDRLGAAVMVLWGDEGVKVEQITAMALANKLGCEENSIHQALKRHGSSLRDFLSRYSTLDDNYTP